MPDIAHPCDDFATISVVPPFEVSLVSYCLILVMIGKLKIIWIMMIIGKFKRTFCTTINFKNMIECNN